MLGAALGAPCAPQHPARRTEHPHQHRAL